MLVPLALALSTQAHAGYPERISLRAMEDYDGAPTVVTAGNDYVAEGYRQMARELGLLVANKPVAPAETLGVNGFAVTVSTAFGFTRNGTLDGTNPSGWDLADPDEAPPIFHYVPQVQVRKGLPLSLEVGANAGWIGQSETGVLGGFARWAPLEGYRQAPDIALQVGWAGYIGNDELELGVADLGATIGYSLPFGTIAGIHQSVFSPFVGLGVQRIHAAPRVSLTGTQLAGRVVERSGSKRDGQDVYDDSFAPQNINGGFSLQNGDFPVSLAGTYAPDLIATATLGFGFAY
jgi:hypothetical protein